MSTDPPSQRPVSLRDIAERSGVTRMAVSLALRAKAGVSEATRRRVLETAAALGYEPDPEVAKLLSRISAKKSVATKACLALLTSGVEAEAWRHSVTERKYVEGARERASTYGYRVDEFWIHEPGTTLARLGKILWSRGIEGVIIAPWAGRLPGPVPREVRLDFGQFAAVEISETVEAPALDRAIHDQYTSMLKVIAELKALNYRRIGLVIEQALDLRANGKWSAAFLYRRYLDDDKILLPPLLMPSASQRVFDKWFERYEPDVVVSVDRFGLQFLEKRGLRIPRDMGYASLDLDGDPGEHGTVSGIDQNSRHVGAAAVDLLVGAIQRGQRGIPLHPMRAEIEGTWVAGRTTRRLPKTAQGGGTFT